MKQNERRLRHRAPLPVCCALVAVRDCGLRDSVSEANGNDFDRFPEMKRNGCQTEVGAKTRAAPLTIGAVSTIGT